MTTPPGYEQAHAAINATPDQIAALREALSTLDPMTPTRHVCHRCGHPYGWRGGISYAAVVDLGRRIREHYATAHPEIDDPGAATR